MLLYQLNFEMSHRKRSCFFCSMTLRLICIAIAMEIMSKKIEQKMNELECAITWLSWYFSNKLKVTTLLALLKI